jgi:hypothetical protein
MGFMVLQKNGVETMEKAPGKAGASAPLVSGFERRLPRDVRSISNGVPIAYHTQNH